MICIWVPLVCVCGAPWSQATAHRLAALAAEVAQLRDERVRMAAIVQSAQAATRSQDEIHQSKIGAFCELQSNGNLITTGCMRKIRACMH